MPKQRNFSSGTLVSEDRFTSESAAKEFAERQKRTDRLVRVTSVYIKPSRLSKKKGQYKGHWVYFVRAYTK
jgi:hypothetical protein